MASGSFERAIQSGQPAASCWEVLTDVDRIAGWVDIVSDVTVKEHLKSYDATLEDRIGPFRLRADLDVAVVKAVENERISFEATGQDRQVGSRLTIRATMTLAEQPDGTAIRFNGTYAVEGRVASVGGPMIHRKADAIIESFMRHASEALA